MAAWFADSVCVVTKEGRRIDAVIIGIASRIFSGGHGRIGFRVAASEIIVNSSSPFHDDVVTETFPSIITDTPLLSQGIDKVGHIA